MCVILLLPRKMTVMFKNCRVDGRLFAYTIPNGFHSELRFE